MSQITESPIRQHARTAGMVAGGVAAVLIVQDAISAIVTVMAGYTMPGYYLDDYVGEILRVVAYSILTLVGFAAGVWLSLWRFAPVAGSLTATVVVVRGLLAAGIGAVLVFLVNVGLGLIGPLSGTGTLFANSFPELNWDGISQAITMALQSGVVAFVQQSPVVVLVALLVWIWLGKQPSRHAESVDAGEV